MTQSIAEVYDTRSTFQWRRLDAFPCEFYIHLTSLLETLPPGSRVLDVGGGPGRYAIELARAGHRVTVGDLSSEMLRLARQHVAKAGMEPGVRVEGGGAVEAVLELDARDLGGFETGSFDAVVALGPFYHLKEAEERRRAAREAARVLRAGGCLFAAFQPRTFWLSLALHTFVTESNTPEAYLDHLDRFVDSGCLDKVKSPHLKGSWFCRPGEIEPLFRSVGIESRGLLASSGVVAPWSGIRTWKAFRDRDPALRQRLFELVRRTAADPSVLGMSDQILFIGERNDSPVE